MSSSPSSLVDPSSRDEIRWSAESYGSAIRLAQVGGLAGAQALFVLAAMLSDLRVETYWAVLLHAVVAVLGAVALRWTGLWQGWFFAAFSISIMLDYAMAAGIGEPLSVLAFVLFLPAVTVPLTLSRHTTGALISVIVVAVLVSASIAWSHPEWGLSIVATSAASLVTISLLAASRMRSLHRLTDQVDLAIAEAAEARRGAAGARASAHSIAEGMRLLHDTIVNTLGSLAASDGRFLEEQSVRERCAQDLDRIRHFFAGTRDPMRDAFSWGGRALLPVQETGMPRAELLRYAAALPAETVDALHGCTLEILRNATKHSGAEAVAVDVRIESDALVVTVSDDGRGFDSATGAGRGLTESFFARASSAGLQATLDSTPGQGTTARIVCPLDAEPTFEAASTEIPVDETVTAMRRRIAWVPALPSLGAALVILLVHPTGFPFTHIAFLVTVALILTMWLTSRGGRTLPDWLAGLVMIALPATVILTIGAADLPDGAYAFPAAMFAVLPIVLDATARSRLPYLLSLILTASTAVAYATWNPDIGADAAVLLAFLLAPPLCILAAWHIFGHQIQRIARATAEAYVRTHEARLAAARDEVAMASRKRLSSAGLAEPLALLGEIADGTLSPMSVEVRLRCRDEERYLRQLLSLPVDAPLVARWLAVALARARSLGISLVLRTEDVRIADRETADAFGRVILSLIDGARPGSELIVSIIRDRQDPHLFVVGERNDRHPEDLARSAAPYPVTIDDLDAQTIVEVVARRTFDPEPTGLRG
ncbi:sensor histidine kinase [Microbacterium sp. NPDC055903]